jgi:hypothetical protein
VRVKRRCEHRSQEDRGLSARYRDDQASYAHRVTICSSCGAESPEVFRFCGSCGAPLAEAAPAREVRKTVTVLFCDVVASIALGERVDPRHRKWRAVRWPGSKRQTMSACGWTLGGARRRCSELAGREDEAKALLDESVEIADRYGHLVAAEKARKRLEGVFG